MASDWLVTMLPANQRSDLKIIINKHGCQCQNFFMKKVSKQLIFQEASTLCVAHNHKPDERFVSANPMLSWYFDRIHPGESVFILIESLGHNLFFLKYIYFVCHYLFSTP